MMSQKNSLVSTSKFLSLVLRHEPQRAGLTLEEGGWVKVDSLLEGCARAGRPLSRELLNQVVADNDKQRFAFSEDGTRIRASQGHSIEVDLHLVAQEPPPRLFHGTADRFLDAILSSGLTKRQRHHVHLTESEDIAQSVGQRHGRAVVLEIDAAAMAREGHVFYRSANGVWLVDHVPVSRVSVLN